jgi:hypothetical protein
LNKALAVVDALEGKVRFFLFRYTLFSFSELYYIQTNVWQHLDYYFLDGYSPFLNMYFDCNIYIYIYI